MPLEKARAVVNSRASARQLIGAIRLPGGPGGAEPFDRNRFINVW
jgi:hypothetical protein